jgi:hypothetical protein
MEEFKIVGIILAIYGFYIKDATLFIAGVTVLGFLFFVLLGLLNLNYSTAISMIDNLPYVPPYHLYLLYSGTLNTFLLSYLLTNYLQFS